jgi:hypothetical protein
VTRWHYHYSGVRIASELPLPEWAVFEESHPVGEPDVVIVSRECLSAPDDDTAGGADECRFTVPQTAQYRVRHGREILVAGAPGASPQDVRIFLLGSALGALFHQRGMLGLHASVVCTARGAVAFCGRTKAGKSTLAAWLCRRGYQFVADDLCRVECVSGGSTVVYPSTPRLKLWRDALAAMQQDHASLERDYRRADKFHVATDPVDVRMPIPLCAIYLLEWADFDIARLRGLRGLQDLATTASYRPDLLRHSDHRAAHWRRCTELAGRVALHRFSRPRDAAALEKSVDLVQAHAARYIGLPA